MTILVTSATPVCSCKRLSFILSWQSKLHLTSLKSFKAICYISIKKRHTLTLRDTIELHLPPLSSHLQVTMAGTQPGKRREKPRKICKSPVFNYTSTGYSWKRIPYGTPPQVSLSNCSTVRPQALKLLHKRFTGAARTKIEKLTARRGEQSP